MVLRGKPDALAFVVPKLTKDPNYQEQDRILLIVWMTAQASQVDLYAGLYSWAHYLLPIAGDKSGCRRKSMDLILQLVENILSKPKALTTLVSGAVRKGQRLIPVSSFEILMRLTFPAPSTRTKATKRFEAIYPLLKQVALLAPENSTGSKRMKEIFTFSLELAEQEDSVLAEEATAIAIWALTENADCFKLWDNLYTENLDASVDLLEKLADEWKDHSIKLSSSPRDALTVSQTLQIFRQKNAIAAITQGRANCSQHNEADKYCKLILGMRREHLLDVAGATYLLGGAVAAAIALVQSYQ
uniref:DUF3730 domain-containing protein n=2 Tax=Noccaea caerulescens TaxID=107243 RepID=A0A1J3IM71_NOCCA